MRFFMISDLHLGNPIDDNLASENITLLASKIRGDISPNEDVLFVILGDLIDRGQRSAFDCAEKHLAHLREELKDYKVKFEFIPGNHDLVDKKLEDFDNFIKKFGANYSFVNSAAVSIVYGGVNFIFADSNLTRDYSKPGELDMKAINSQIKDEMQNVLFCHHSLTHRTGEEHNFVKDGEVVSAKLRAMGIDFCFHSHTHACDITFTGGKVSEIGCGSISKDVSDMPGINNQFSVGGIRDGKIVGIERWIKTSDGKNKLAYEALFPEGRKFTDPEKIGKKQYNNVPEPHIVREIYRIKGDDSYLHFLQRMPLVDVLGESGRIFLLGNAGDGKTIELQKLAHDLYETPFFPFLYFLKDYTNEAIDDIIPKEYADLNPNRLVLIFDGYDEIQKDYRHNFEGKLNSYLGKNPAVRVIVSSRRNFCKISSDGNSRTLRDFVEYEFAQISDGIINDYLAKLKIDPKVFRKASESSRVSEMICNPFYLSGLTKIFIAENKLPSKNLVMEKIIDQCFLRDDEKFSNEDLEETKLQHFHCLENVAFAMQLMCKNQITDDEYQEIIPLKQRMLIKPSGLFSRLNGTWQFTHNNFREYLAARRLKTMTIESILKYCCVENEIKPSWANTFGYLIGLSNDVQLSSWAINNACETLIKYDPENIDASKHFEIFKKVFEKYERNYINSYEGLCSESELAYYACNTRCIDYLINKIYCPVNRFSLYNALCIIQYLPKSCGKQTAMRACLIKVCRDYPKNYSSERQSAIRTICWQKLYNSDVTKVLMELFENSDDDFIRTGMYEYLVCANEQDKYVQFFLDGIRFITGSPILNGQRILDESWALLQGLKAMSSAESISSVLKWFCDSENIYFHNSDDVFCELSSKVSNLYQYGTYDLFDVMYNCWIWAVKHDKSRELSAISEFFAGTGTYEEAVLRLIDTAAPESFYFGILSNNCPQIIDVLERLYRERRLPDGLDFSDFVKRNFGAKEYKQFSKLILEVENKMLPELSPIIDYAKERKDASLEYLSCLFEKSSYKELINKLLLEAENDNITVGELKDQIRNHKYHLPIARVKFAVMRRLFPNKRVKDFFENVDWQEFCINEIHDLIRNESLELDDNQKNAVTKMILEKCEKGILDNAFSKDGGLWERVRNTVHLAVLFKIPLTKTDLSRLTVIPWFAFSDNDSRKKYSYLEEVFSESELIAQVVKDVQSDPGNSNTLADHIDYLFDKKCEDIAEKALSICIQEQNDTEASRRAVKYLHDLFGSEYIEHELLPHCGISIVNCIAQMFSDIDRDELKSAMERVYNRGCDDELQARLIAFNSRKALEDYLDKVRKTNSAPQDDGNFFGGTTNAVSFVNDSNLIPLLEELTKIIFVSTFKDGDFFSLRSSLYKAFINCTKAASKRVLESIDNLANFAVAENDIAYLCRLKNDILRECIVIQDTPLPIKEVKNIISKID